MVRKIVVMVTVAGALILSACNTVRGAGRDVQSAGQAVENASH